MKKFVFSLESVLAAKRLLEQDAKRNLAQAEEKLAFAQQQLDRLSGEQDRALQSWYILVQKGFQSHSLLQEVHHVDSLREQVAQQQIRLNQVLEERNLCQEQLREIFTEVKALKTMRDQQYVDFLAEEARLRDKEMDEFVSFNRHRTVQISGHA